MVERSKGFRVGTRKKLRKKVRDRGRIKIRKTLQEFEEGDKVIIEVDSSYHKGMPHKRFFGKHGKIIEKRGKSYLVESKLGNKPKKIICSSIHLRKA